MPAFIALLILGLLFHYAWHWLIWPVGIVVGLFIVRALFENWIIGVFGIVLGTIILGIFSYLTA